MNNSNNNSGASATSDPSAPSGMPLPVVDLPFLAELSSDPPSNIPTPVPADRSTSASTES